MSKKIILTAEDIRRALVRIAHEIIERNKAIERLILVGVHTRGVPLAKRLAANIVPANHFPAAIERAGRQCIGGFVRDF